MTLQGIFKNGLSVGPHHAIGKPLNPITRFIGEAMGIFSSEFFDHDFLPIDPGFFRFHFFNPHISLRFSSYYPAWYVGGRILVIPQKSYTDVIRFSFRSSDRPGSVKRDHLFKKFHITDNKRARDGTTQLNEFDWAIIIFVDLNLVKEQELSSRGPQLRMRAVQ